MGLIDHLVVTAATREAGAAHVEAALGQAMGPGGRHVAMGTHNRLLSLGDPYLEAIAIDPDAPPPGRPRWYGLDARAGPPRLTHWALRVDDLEAAVAAWPEAGRVLPFGRDGLAWRMAVPEDGRLPFDGCAPALIEWDGPMPALPERGCRLARLMLRHPQAAALRARLGALTDDPRILVKADAAPGLSARIDAPDGPKVLE
jgi:hypothetical protein